MLSWWLDSDGRVGWARLPLDTVFGGEQLGRRVQAQRAGWPILEEDQRDLLTAVGIEADPGLVAAKAAAEAKPTVSRGDRFAQGLAALAQFVQRERHARVPRPHKGPWRPAPVARSRWWSRTSRWAPGSTTRKPAARS
ncbi:hypothetical protein [Streptomyces sp. TLI_053]|uniref:hypothetical protein n=1 Tax=Streptomyces sp. TLI_053 TaxID=1855352 RepID=UPI000AE3C9EA|nr:hypothetical protein [Streptomyces sp. TLI_053]